MLEIPFKTPELKLNDGANTLARMHQIKGLIDIFEGHFVSNQIINIDFAIHIPVDNARHIGATAGTAKGGSTPRATGNQLEMVEW